jgi:hypothetical protein
MQKSKKSTKCQLAVLEDLFGGRLSERTVVKKHSVSRQRYRQWFAQERFAKEFEQRVNEACRQSHTILARSAPGAAKKLVKLTNSDQEKTARKACFDIITGPRPAQGATPSKPHAPEPDLPREKATHSLAALAKGST